MKPFGIRRLGLLGAVGITVFVPPAANATTADVDLGTVAYAINVNASIFNTSISDLPQTYTYNQLVYIGSNLGMVLPSGLTVAQTLAALGYVANPGILYYNFPFSLGASGSYAINGSPPNAFPATVSLTATSVSGNVCSGFNNVGATISVDPTNAASTYETILGCDGLTTPNNGFPESTTSTVTANLGTYATDGVTTSAETTYTAEVTTTTWESSGIANAPASVPEPSTMWLAAAGFAALCATRIRWRRCA